MELELTLAATQYLQRFTCSETCQAEEAPECPEDPADLGLAALGEPLPSHGLPSATWVHEEGERTVATYLECLRGPDRETSELREVYRVLRTTHAGCADTTLECRYERSQLPADVELPCGEWLNVTFPFDQP